MATRVVMEALSPTMEEGRLVAWKKQEGEPVAVGDVLAEVETDKAVMELVARHAGVLLRHLVEAGATVPVASPVGVIGEKGETVDAGANGAAARAAVPAAAGSAPARPAAAPAPAAVAVATVAVPAARPGGRVKASPLARKIAAERGLDLTRVAGSGPAGRIVERDLRAVAAAPTVAVPAGDAFRDVPLTQLRKTIARRLVQSIGPIPTFYLTADIDMERVAEARDALNAAAEVKVSFNDIIVKAVAAGLVRHPDCNAWWQDDRIRYWNEVHVGMAVAVDDGLITPVIRHADRKALTEIASETRDLATRARERRLRPEEYTGSTFSVSNLGMFDIEHFTAIINPPEAGILAIGRINPEPVVQGGAVAVRRRMRVTMSCDHRVIDGATGARFLRTVKGMLENPLAML